MIDPDLSQMLAEAERIVAGTAPPLPAICLDCAMGAHDYCTGCACTHRADYQDHPAGPRSLPPVAYGTRRDRQPCARCGHQRTAHTHYHSRTYCGACYPACPAFQRHSPARILALITVASCAMWGVVIWQIIRWAA